MLGIGESYVRGWWECSRIDELACRVLSHGLLAHVKNGWSTIFADLSRRVLNLQSERNAHEVADKHYDVGNEFFESILGPTMVYSCAYWKNAADLDQAQANKLELVCRKLELERSDSLLDIGCGWGSLAKHAAQNHGCRVTGITISRKQFDYASRLCEGLPIKILLTDYRAESLRSHGPFSKIVSVGMFEHVGAKNYRRFMEIAHALLSSGGLFLLHTIGTHGATGHDAWINRHVFPNGELPSLASIARAIDGLFVMEDWHNFGADYDKTLMAWYENLEKRACPHGFAMDRAFYRTWRYFLLACAGSFRARNVNQLWQIVLSKGGVPDGYLSVR